MFERFTEGARQVVVLAQHEAQGLRHNHIGTEHLLLGLLSQDQGVAARVLESLDITLEEMRAQIARIVGKGDEVTTGQIPFTPRAKKVLDLAMREALSLGHTYIGTEHILLGIVRENEGVAARILLDFDAGAEMIRNEVVRVLAGVEPSGSPESRASQLKHSHITLRGFRPGPSLPHQSRQISMGGRPPWWQPILLHTAFWFGMVMGSVLFGAGLFVGWLIWG